MKSFICRKQMRLDMAISEELKMPRNQVSKLIKDVGVKVNSKSVKKPSFSLLLDSKVEIDFPNMIKTEPKYEVNFDVEILYEDEYLLIVNKPPFLTVHPAPSVKEATLVDWLKQKDIRLSTLSGEERHGIVHRIDKQTSGALVVAKTNKSHVNLAKQLEDKSLGRYYLALTNLPLKENCIINKPIARNPKNRLKMGIVENTKEAKSAFYNLDQSQNSRYGMILAKLYTGRTHQIRVHLESISRAILGDNLYGFKSQKVKIPRVMLHAYILHLKHPITHEPLLVRAGFFDDFETLCNKYFKRNENDEIFKTEHIVECFSGANSWVQA